ncbi:MAG: hypothetical protein ACHQNE_07110, partial [Candidatus Kapaibacterium sp.]
MANRFDELESLLERDFELRQELLAHGELFGGYHPRMEMVHVENGKRLEFLLDAFGWPDTTLDGDAARKNAWYIV